MESTVSATNPYQLPGTTETWRKDLPFQLKIGKMVAEMRNGEALFISYPSPDYRGVVRPTNGLLLGLHPP